jgi:hypothetical protein
VNVEVQLRDERGKVIPKGGAVINFELPLSSLLQYIDPWGNTVFNALQMDDFLREWDCAKEMTQSEEQRAQWEKVRRLAIECRDGSHIYLTFIGD